MFVELIRSITSISKMEIVPACIPKSFTEWEDFVLKMGSVGEKLHLDVCDGKFVPSISWPIAGDSGEWRKFVSQEEGLPNWDLNEFEVDLMVSNPESRFREFIEAGFSRVIIHWESLGENPAESIELILSDGRADFWLAASPLTDPSDYLPFLGGFGGFQCMGILKIGFQGQPFENKALDVVRAVRSANPELQISVDGAVSIETAGAIVSAGATKLVVGSALSRSDNPISVVNEILDSLEI